MKRVLHSLVLSMVFGVICWELAGCKHTPSPPTEQDAIAVWNNINRKSNYHELLSLQKTNGQMQTANGVNIYTLYYQAKIKSTVQLGDQPPGTVKTYTSNYPFQWTEKGWMGPDNQIYPEH